MKLLEFITWCELNDIVTHHMEIPNVYDHKADSHHKLIINQGDINKGDVALEMRYAMMQGQARMINGYMFIGSLRVYNPTMKQITEAFFPDEVR